jgi:TPP-dependent pyruvate/acetoin dehydrogenase alpha subunit
VRAGIDEELAEWEKRDPLKRLAESLIGRGMASAEDLERMRRQEEVELEKALAQVLAEK